MAASASPTVPFTTAPSNSPLVDVEACAPWNPIGDDMPCNQELTPDLAYISTFIARHEDFPKPGIVFRDIFPLFRHPEPTRLLLTSMTSLLQRKYSNVDIIVGLDSRGFLFGPTLALNLDAGFVPIRKVGKLPGTVTQLKYETEYSQSLCEIQTDSIKSGQRVIIVDDLLATGGTLLSACELVRRVGGQVLGCLVVMELVECNGRERLRTEGKLSDDRIHSLLNY